MSVGVHTGNEIRRAEFRQKGQCSAGDSAVGAEGFQGRDEDGEDQAGRNRRIAAL